MCTSSQKSASSSTSSNQFIPTPSTSSKKKSTSSSTSRKVQHGSRISHHSSSSSATSSASSSRSSHKDPANQKFQGEAISRYENEPRDYKSWAVEEYDAYQEQAKGEHRDDVERNVEGVKWAC